MAHARTAHGRVLDHRRSHPFLSIGRKHGGQRDGHGQRLGRNAAAPHQLVQRYAFGAQVVFSGQLLRSGEVKTRLCFAGIGDGGRTDFKVALGGRQLFRDGLFTGQCRAIGVLRGQHIEVGLRQTNDEVLFSRVEVRLRHFQALARLLHRHSIGAVEQRVLAADGTADAVAVTGADARLAQLREGGVGHHRRGGLEQCVALIDFELRRTGQGTRSLIGRIKRTRRFVKRLQVLRLGGRGHGKGYARSSSERNRQALEIHGLSLSTGFGVDWPGSIPGQFIALFYCAGACACSGHATRRPPGGRVAR